MVKFATCEGLVEVYTRGDDLDAVVAAADEELSITAGGIGDDEAGDGGLCCNSKKQSDSD